ncbi:MAG: WG repeat-containing protein, partial [Flavobacteriales bacterium]|nr:WG repeat-containing protein [Flavobacteriales bacterium]
IINEKNEIAQPLKFKTCNGFSPHTSGKFNRKDGFYAFTTIVNKNTIEHYYFNFNPALNQIIIKENYSRGFTIGHKTCRTNSNSRCYGVINYEREIVIPYIYSYIKQFKQNIYIVSTKNKVGIIDTSGTLIIPAQYKQLYDLSSKHQFIVARDFHHSSGLFLYNGQQIADTVYGGFERPIANLIPFYANMNYRYMKRAGWTHDKKQIGFMDFSGKIVVQPIFDSYSYRKSSPNEITLRKGNQTLKVDLKGNLIEGKWPISTEVVQVKSKSRKGWGMPRKKRKKTKTKAKVRFL